MILALLIMMWRGNLFGGSLEFISQHCSMQSDALTEIHWTMCLMIWIVMLRRIISLMPSFQHHNKHKNVSLMFWLYLKHLIPDLNPQTDFDIMALRLLKDCSANFKQEEQQ